ncbi:serine hydrolase domain-containing protein [Pseudonocardia xinjiangensis]|uniref:serine hydrolase domain-containing protein n=1 Tax=Pseudonocardia xinjiangensis TaxID=75289 RepID=UPI003D8CE774
MTYSWRSLGVVAAAVVLAVTPMAACGTSTAPAPPAGAEAPADAGGPLPPATVAGIEQIVHDQMRTGAVPGMAVGVWLPGQGQLVRAYGVADVASGAAFAVGDRVRIASITKTFTATATLMLVDRGRLTLDDRLESFVPGVPNGRDITVRQLLNMTSGVYDFTEDPEFSAAFDADPLAPFPVERVLTILRRSTPAFPPGQPGSWQYSDSNYILLGQIIERAAGEPAGPFIEREIVGVLNLPGTSYPTSPEIPPPSASGYLVVPPGAPQRDVTALDPDVAGPAGAMISTVEGLRAWAGALAAGRLLSPAGHAEQTTFVNANLSPTLRTGYGAGLFEINDFVGHNGAIYGFNTAMFQLPRTGATIVVVANRSSNFEGVGLETFLQIAMLLYPDLFSS